MSDFNNTILKAISDYKFILRKNLAPTQCTDKMRELGIKRKYIKNVDETRLYKIGLTIIAELKKNISVGESKRSANFYHGTEEFLQYLEGVFSEYYLENDKVVHVGQKSSCALVAAIQLISMPQEEMTEEIRLQIKQYGEMIALHGSDEQKRMFNAAVGSNQDLLINFFQNCPKILL